MRGEEIMDVKMFAIRGNRVNRTFWLVGGGVKKGFQKGGF